MGNLQLALDQFNKLDNFNALYLGMVYDLKQGIVHAYDNAGNVITLTDEHKAKIKQLEEDGKEFDKTIFAVIESDHKLGFDTVHFTTYLWVTSEGDDIIPYDNGMYYCYSTVVNSTWDIEESGSVVIAPSYKQTPIRYT